MSTLVFHRTAPYQWATADGTYSIERGPAMHGGGQWQTVTFHNGNGGWVIARTFSLDAARDEANRHHAAHSRAFSGVTA